MLIFLVLCIIISFIVSMLVVHGRMSVLNDFFCPALFFCFSLCYVEIFEQIKMNEWMNVYFITDELLLAFDWSERIMVQAAGLVSNRRAIYGPK